MTQPPALPPQRPAHGFDADPQASAAPDASRGWRTWCLAAFSLAFLIFLVHGISLRGGLFMDDWAHLRQLREAGWNLRDLVDACRLELVGGIAEMWFMPECTLRFFRPVAFALMKLPYTLANWDLTWGPFVMHAVSLGWHLSVCLLLMRLLERLGAQRLHAWFATAFFAVHPGHVATVQWIAVQTELIVTAFLLIATLSFARFRGWGSGALLPRDSSGSLLAGATCLLFFTLALGCRENAIMFPFVMAATEPMARKDRRRHALILYAAMAVLIVAYLFIRSAYLGGFQVPPRPYIYPPTDPGFVKFIFDKLCYYLIGEFLLVPCIPIGGLPYFLTMPLLFYGMSAVVGALLLWSLLRFCRQPPGWLGPAWMVFFLGPLLPSFSSPHHLYLAGIGAAIVVWTVLRALVQVRTAPKRSRAFSRKEVVYTLTSLGLVSLILLSAFLPVLAIDTGQRVEDTIASEIAQAPHPLRDGDTLYVVNLPIIAHYLKLIVEEQTGLRDLRVVPLTWAPRILGLFGTAARAEYNWHDEKTLDIRIVRDRWFSAVLGQLVRESLGREAPVPPEGLVFRDQSGNEDFTVHLLESDASGIQCLRFAFRQPPLRPGSHVFWGSNIRWAFQLSRPQMGPDVSSN